MSINNLLKANGKLLLSGEYLVLNGAKALAFPICFGQEMTVTEGIHKSILNWSSSNNNQEWFNATIDLVNLDITKTSDTAISLALKRILIAARSLNKEFLSTQSGFNININANYPLEWGFGSSSTLISLIASWANVNEHSLYKMVSNGSGYDVACATQHSPIFYQLLNDKPIITKAEIGDGIKNHCLFAYLGNKQDSNEEVERYKNYETPSSRIIERISELSVAICNASNAVELIEYINEHEQILSSLLNKTILAQQERFHGFNGAVKSLGAWGGDFAMFVADKQLKDLRVDLMQMGISIMFSYDELKIKS